MRKCETCPSCFKAINGRKCQHCGYRRVRPGRPRARASECPLLLVGPVIIGLSLFVVAAYFLVRFREDVQHPKTAEQEHREMIESKAEQLRQQWEEDRRREAVEMEVIMEAMSKKGKKVAVGH